MTWSARSSSVCGIVRPSAFAVLRLMTNYLPRHELMVCAFRNVIPSADQRLELRERRVHLPGHGGLFGFFLDALGCDLLEIAEDWRRALAHPDLRPGL